MLVDDAVVEVARLLLGLRRGDQFAGPDQDLPGVVFGDHLTARLPAFDQLEDVKAGRAAQGGRHLAGLQVGHGVDEGRRNLVQPAPAEVAAVECIRRVRVADRGGVEVHAALDGVERLLGLGLRRLDVGRRAAGRDADLDVRQMHFAGLVGGAGEEVVDFAVGDADLVADDAVVQPLHGELVGELGAEGGERAALLLDRGAQLVRRHLVLLGDAGHRLVDVGVGDADALFLGLLHLQAHQYQAVEHLPAQHVERRQLAGVVGILLLHGAHRLVELALQDDIVVDHRDDAVEHAVRVVLLRQQLRRCGQGKECGERHQDQR
jgi:hypothetical protein